MVFEHLRRAPVKTAGWQARTGRAWLARARLQSSQILSSHQPGAQFAPCQGPQRLRPIARIERARIGKCHVHEGLLPPTWIKDGKGALYL